MPSEQPHQNKYKHMAIMGGSFNPIHLAHVECAQQVVQQLGIEHLKFIPNGTPAHKQDHEINAEHRCNMVELAIRNQSSLSLDKTECLRKGPSYTIDTLKELRQSLGQTIPLNFIMGMDSFINFNTWKHWQEFLNLCHIIVINRPNYSIPTQGSMLQLLQQHQTLNQQDLQQQSHGRIYLFDLPDMDISSSGIRQLHSTDNKNTQKSEEQLIKVLHTDVLNYLKQHQLLNK